MNPQIGEKNAIDTLLALYDEVRESKQKSPTEKVAKDFFLVQKTTDKTTSDLKELHFTKKPIGWGVLHWCRKYILRREPSKEYSLQENITKISEFFNKVELSSLDTESAEKLDELKNIVNAMADHKGITEKITKSFTQELARNEAQNAVQLVPTKLSIEDSFQDEAKKTDTFQNFMKVREALNKRAQELSGTVKETKEKKDEIIQEARKLANELSSWQEGYIPERRAELARELQEEIALVEGLGHSEGYSLEGFKGLCTEEGRLGLTPELVKIHKSSLQELIQRRKAELVQELQHEVNQVENRFGSFIENNQGYSLEPFKAACSDVQGITSEKVAQQKTALSEFSQKIEAIIAEREEKTKKLQEMGGEIAEKLGKMPEDVKSVVSGKLYTLEFHDILGWLNNGKDPNSSDWEKWYTAIDETFLQAANVFKEYKARQELEEGSNALINEYISWLNDTNKEIPSGFNQADFFVGTSEIRDCFKVLATEVKTEAACKKLLEDEGRLLGTLQKYQKDLLDHYVRDNKEKKAVTDDEGKGQIIVKFAGQFEGQTQEKLSTDKQMVSRTPSSPLTLITEVTFHDMRDEAVKALKVALPNTRKDINRFYNKTHEGKKASKAICEKAKVKQDELQEIQNQAKQEVEKREGAIAGKFQELSAKGALEKEAVAVLENELRMLKEDPFSKILAKPLNVQDFDSKKEGLLDHVLERIKHLEDRIESAMTPEAIQSIVCEKKQELLLQQLQGIKNTTEFQEYAFFQEEGQRIEGSVGALKKSNPDSILDEAKAISESISKLKKQVDEVKKQKEQAFRKDQSLQERLGELERRYSTREVSGDNVLLKKIHSQIEKKFPAALKEYEPTDDGEKEVTRTSFDTLDDFFAWVLGQKECVYEAKSLEKLTENFSYHKEFNSFFMETVFDAIELYIILQKKVDEVDSVQQSFNLAVAEAEKGSEEQRERAVFANNIANALSKSFERQKKVVTSLEEETLEIQLEVLRGVDSEEIKKIKEALELLQKALNSPPNTTYDQFKELERLISGKVENLPTDLLLKCCKFVGVKESKLSKAGNLETIIKDLNPDKTVKVAKDAQAQAYSDQFDRLRPVSDKLGSTPEGVDEDEWD